MHRKRISKAEFHELTRPLLGLSISRTWRGHGSAIFLELGELTEHQVTLRNGHVRSSLYGQATVMIEWSWRVERPQSIAFGSWSGDRKISNGLKNLGNLSVVEIGVAGRLPELVVNFSGEFWVHSFMTAESQPEWCLFLNRDQWVDSLNGKLHLTTKESKAT